MGGRFFGARRWFKFGMSYGYDVLEDVSCHDKEDYSYDQP